jgi:hypothetical protein
MVTPGNKPRDIKNLKARLGRTITPGQAGTPSVPPGMIPGVAPKAASVPPPAVGGAFPTPAPGSVPGLGGSSPGSLRAPGFPGVAAPPFARPAAGQPAGAPQKAPAAAAPAARIDPFGGAAPAVAVQTKKVKLVIDDSAIKDDELGRKTNKTATILAVIGTVLGLAVGLGIGSTAGDRRQMSMALADGKDIYAKVQEVSKQIDQARGFVKQAVDASSGGPGRKATVDFSAVEQLVAMQRPFAANEFHRRLYRAFEPALVDDLFDYYNNINILWDAFTALGAKTAGQGKRDALTKSAAATDGLISTEYGMVLSKNGPTFAGGLVFVTIPQAGSAPVEDPKKGKEPEAPKLQVASVQGGQTVERTLYMGQEGLGEDYEKYVFMVDKIRSRTILGEAANLFAKYRADLMDINMRMDKTTETQGRLIQGLGKIAAMKD